MIWFPLLEKLVEWVKDYGSPLYWWFVIIIGLIGAIVIKMIELSGFNDALPYLFGMVILWLCGGIALAPHENKYHDKRRKDKGDG